MIKGTLITENGLDLPCVVLPTRRSLFPVGEEVMVYCQNRLVKGFVPDNDYDMIAEIEIIADFCIIPEMDEILYESCTE